MARSCANFLTWLAGGKIREGGECGGTVLGRWTSAGRGNALVGDGAAGNAKLQKLGLESATERRRVMSIIKGEDETPTLMNWYEVGGESILVLLMGSLLIIAEERSQNIPSLSKLWSYIVLGFSGRPAIPDHAADFDSRFLAGAFGSPDNIKCHRRRGTRSVQNHMEGVSWQS